MVPVGVTFAPLVYTWGLDLDLEIKLHLGNNTGEGLPAKEEETHATTGTMMSGFVFEYES